MLKILFLGQCLQYGYEGVDRHATFPTITAAALKAQFRGLNFKFDFKYLYHPRGLKALLQHRLLLTRPDIAVINLPAMFAATSWRVNLVYELAPELVDTARSLVHRIESGLRRSGPAHSGRSVLDNTFKLHRPLALDEYEKLVEEALSYAQRISICRLVLIGPGRFNQDSIERYAVHSPELWASSMK